MHKGLKVAALSLIAVVIAAAVMLYTPRITANASVYRDGTYNGTITGTIENESFGTSNASSLAAINIAYSANLDGGYTHLLNYPQINEIYIDECTISFIFGYDANAQNITCGFFLSNETEYIYTAHYSAAIRSGANFWSFGIANTATTVQYYITINDKIYTHTITTSEVSYTANRLLSVYSIFGGYETMDTFSGGNYDIGYGLINYKALQRICFAVADGEYQDGYQAGLIDGADNWDSFVGWDWLRAAISIVGTVLTIEIAPNIYLGYFVALPLILGAVMFVLQFKR